MSISNTSAQFRDGNYHSRGYINFNANKDTNAKGNPMAGHANASEIRPYNVAMLPLIAY